MGRGFRAVAIGGALGACAGLIGALSDYGAHWLWLEGVRDRSWLALCVLALQVPAGAALGIALALGAWLVQATVDARMVRADVGTVGRLRLQAVGLTVLVAPYLCWFGYSLFRGGKMARLPGKLLL